MMTPIIVAKVKDLQWIPGRAPWLGRTWKQFASSITAPLKWQLNMKACLATDYAMRYPTVTKSSLIIP